MALLGALCFAGGAVGFTHRSLRAQVSQLLGAAYSTNQMSYDLARLRINALIERREHTNTTTSPQTDNVSRSSTPKSTTVCSVRYWPPASHPHQPSSVTR